MAQVVRDLQNGKSVRLNYRHRVIGILKPIDEPPQALRRGSFGAVQQFLKAASFGPIPPKLRTSSRSFKQEVTELRESDLA